jgi:hypothetical protein
MFNRYILVIKLVKQAKWSDALTIRAKSGLPEFLGDELYSS